MFFCTQYSCLLIECVQSLRVAVDSCPQMSERLTYIYPLQRPLRCSHDDNTCINTWISNMQQPFTLYVPMHGLRMHPSRYMSNVM